MAKKIVGFIKLQVPAGKANPSPPIGPALGQRGLNIMEFCKAFNAQTQGMEPGMPIPVTITAFADKSFTFIMGTPPATYLIKKEAKIQKGSPKPLRWHWRSPPPPQNSMNRSTSRSTSASMPRNPTRPCAAQLFCRRAQAKPSVLQCSPKAPKLRKPRQRVRTWWVLTTSPSASKAASLISTW